MDIRLEELAKTIHTKPLPETNISKELFLLLKSETEKHEELLKATNDLRQKGLLQVLHKSIVWELENKVPMRQKWRTQEVIEDLKKFAFEIGPYTGTTPQIDIEKVAARHMRLMGRMRNPDVWKNVTSYLIKPKGNILFYPIQETCFVHELIRTDFADFGMTSTQDFAPMSMNLFQLDTLYSTQKWPDNAVAFITTTNKKGITKTTPYQIAPRGDNVSCIVFTANEIPKGAYLLLFEPSEEI